MCEINLKGLIHLFVHLSRLLSSRRCFQGYQTEDSYNYADLPSPPFYFFKDLCILLDLGCGLGINIFFEER